MGHSKSEPEQKLSHIFAHILKETKTILVKKFKLN